MKCKEPQIEVGLHASIVAIEADSPLVLTVPVEHAQSTELASLPFGPFIPDKDRTLEQGLRRWVEKQTNLKLGYVEQLYTFGDRGRFEQLTQGDYRQHFISIGYLALVKRFQTQQNAGQSNLSWNSWYTHFPWEDWRHGMPAILHNIVEQLAIWSKSDPGQTPSVNDLDRGARLRLAFAYRPSEDQLVDYNAWDEERVLERYELMYEAGLVEEAVTDGHVETLTSDFTPGTAMVYDHRRILATAMARLRAKLKYRPIIFELLPEQFTLTELQRTVEMLAGRLLHKQNFRRLVENAQLVEPTGATSSSTGGRPAAYFRFRRSIQRERPAPGLKF